MAAMPEIGQSWRMPLQTRPLGDHLRDWRQRRRLSQLDLALDAEISTRHLSFLETGRARPSRDMVLRLAERLDVPLRERNVLLTAAGFAPVYARRELDDPALAPAREAIELILKAQEPYPALAIDRGWTMVSANGAVSFLLADLPGEVLRPPVNVLRLSLHPAGLAPRIENLPEWRAHLLARLRRDVEVTADPALDALAHELVALSPPERAGRNFGGAPQAGIAVPLRIRTQAGTLSLLSTTTVFGTPVEITLSELAIESFFPADPETAAILQRQAACRPANV